MSKEAEDDVSVVEKVKEYLMVSDKMEEDFMGFCRAHCDVIDLEADEYKLEYTALHNKFLAFFEEKVAEVITAAGSTPIEFYRQLKASSRSDAAGEDAEFVVLLLKAVEFESFIGIMKETAEEVTREAAHK